MDILMITYPFGILIMFAVGIAAGIFFTRRYRLGWGLYLIGAATFVFSQIGHIPFNIIVGAALDEPISQLPATGRLVATAVFLGLSSGLWEEWARYLVLRFWVKDARSWGQAMVFGAGHGGIEAIITGVLALLTFLAMTVYRGMDLSALVPPEQLAMAQQEFDNYWGAPWYFALMPGFERVFAVIAHLSMAGLVMHSFISGKIRWVWASVLVHATLNAVAVVLMEVTNVYVTEAYLGVFSLGCLAIILWLRKVQPLLPEEEPLPPPPEPVEAPPLPDLDESVANLERTRFE